jgi:pSer/pThr/pTyr-binding forkhead associated (FHA) protein
MPKLVHTIEGAMFREHALEEGALRIGRNLDNDIQLDDSAVSGHHAQIIVKPSQYLEGLSDVWAKDLNSTNGTMVNGQRIKQSLLKHEDVVKIGTHQFKFVDEEAVAAQRTRVLLDPEE